MCRTRNPTTQPLCKAFGARRTRLHPRSARHAPWTTKQGALFQIEGPDDDGGVGACSAAGRDVWCQSTWTRQSRLPNTLSVLGSIDYGDACRAIAGYSKPYSERWVRFASSLARSSAWHRLSDARHSSNARCTSAFAAPGSGSPRFRPISTPPLNGGELACVSPAFTKQEVFAARAARSHRPPATQDTGQ